VQLTDHRWQAKHWKTIEANYRRTSFFSEIADILEPLYRQTAYQTLTQLNRTFIDAVCRYLQISTKISYSWDYAISEGKNERLLDICRQSGATHYLSGPAARSYLDERAFEAARVNVSWFDYANYPEYPQLWGKFEHGVSIIDLLFNCGPSSYRHMKFSLGKS
jgi:hypothetical protein